MIIVSGDFPGLRTMKFSACLYFSSVKSASVAPSFSNNALTAARRSPSLHGTASNSALMASSVDTSGDGCWAGAENGVSNKIRKMAVRREYELIILSRGQVTLGCFRNTLSESWISRKRERGPDPDSKHESPDIARLQRHPTCQSLPRSAPTSNCIRTEDRTPGE